MTGKAGTVSVEGLSKKDKVLMHKDEVAIVVRRGYKGPKW